MGFACQGLWVMGCKSLPTNLVEPDEYRILGVMAYWVLEYRKVTRLGIESRPSGHIPDALTTELSSFVGFNHTMNFMYLPPQVMVTSHPQRTTQSTVDHQGQPNDDSAATT